MTQEASSCDHSATRKSRKRRIVATAAMGITARVVNAAVQVLSVALTVRYLGPERYGLWVNLLVVAIWTGLSNFGLGAALVSQIAHADGAQQREKARRLISSATAAVTVLSAVLLLGFMAVWAFVPWHSIFGLSSPSLWPEADWGVLVCVLLILLTLPFRLGEPVLNGYQHGHLVNGCYIVGTIANLAGLLIGVKLHVNIPLLVLLTLGMQTSGTLLGWYMARRLGFVEFHLSDVNWTDIRETTFSGGLFFLLQTYLLVTQSMTIIIANRLGSESVTPFAVTQRLFFLIISIVNTSAAPLWPAFGEAASRGDIVWVRKALHRALWLTVVLWIAMAAVLGPFGKQIIQLWSGPNAVPSTMLLLCLLFFALFQSLQIVLAMFLNGLRLLRVQVIAGGLTAAVQVIGGFLVAPRWGVGGVALVQCAATGLIGFPALYIAARRALVTLAQHKGTTASAAPSAQAS